MPGSPTMIDLHVGEADPALDRRLSEEIFRWEGVPTAGQDDVHLMKQL